ncbi:MAG: D-alanine--D-alanine ligase, partial [Patescibacteria group bacterium]
SKIYVNEINTIPGSLSFYLWEPSGGSFTELTTKLIELAFERQRDKDTTMFSIDSSLLENLGNGAKQP